MNICVYCSANNNIADEYKALAAELGSWIAESGNTLVYGGATGGLMTAVSDAAAAHHGDVTGVIPQRIISAGREAANCTEQHIVRTMNERKQRMKQLADMFICLPGSYGTLDEMFDVIASGTVGEHNKPLVILNYQGFYQPLIEQIKAMKEKAFIPKQENYSPLIVTTLDELIDKCQKIQKQFEARSLKQ